MARIVTGTLTRPPHMYDQFAAWLTIWSTARSMKSIRGWITTTRIPASAAPMAAPVVALSDTGESMTRSRPNSRSRSFMLLPTYHGLHTPCPIAKTSGSSASAWAKPSRMASA